MRRFFRRPLVRLLLRVAAAGALALGLVVLAGWLLRERQVEEARPFMTADVKALPAFDVALVLGTAPLNVRRHWTGPNMTFVYRIDAAAELWHAGKVKYFIVSGNRTGDYDEPSVMRAGLIERGVPAHVIYRDFAGFRTNDSLRRAASLFGVRRLVIVSQPEHLVRALFLARGLGLQAWGFEARSEPRRFYNPRDDLNLIATALLARWDIWWGTPPRENGGPPVAIGVDPPN